MIRQQVTAACGALMGLLLLSTIGCGTGLFPDVNVEVPDAAQQVLENAADFIAADNDPMETTAPGTVVDDLDTLDGCWGTVFTEADVESQLSLFSVYHFDAAEKTYVSWAFAGLRDQGVLWPFLPLISEESGTYELKGDSKIEMTITRMRANTTADGGTITATLQEMALDGADVTRTGLITIDGDKMLFFIGVETAADVDEQEERPIYFKFNCPD